MGECVLDDSDREKYGKHPKLCSRDLPEVDLASVPIY